MTQLPSMIEANLEYSLKGDPGYVVKLPAGWTVKPDRYGRPSILVKKTGSHGTMDPLESIYTAVGIKVVEDV